tara:strand:+ start:553 stop:882 length:330 start_codon:yes stop_codon:yes gene_type:complete
MRDTDPDKAVDYILKHSTKFAEAKAGRVYLEEYRKSLKAILMTRSTESAVTAQERDAYAHDEYQQLLLEFKNAVFLEEKLRWDLIAAQARVEIWRTKSANDRAEGKATL